jgi:hypothetical protein
VKSLARHDGYARVPATSALGIRANLRTYSVSAYGRILCFMQEENKEHERTLNTGVEYRKGCPACEHSNPELERELQAFAQLLFDIYLDKREKKRPPSTGIDNISRLSTLK